MEGTQSAVKSFLLEGRAPQLFCSFCFGFLILGCGKHIDSSYKTYAPPIDASSNSLIERSNAYSDYLTAAQEFDAGLGKDTAFLTKASFSPGEQAKIEKAANRPLSRVRIALQKVCKIPYSSPHSQAAVVGRAEWRLMERVLVWRIQRACEAKSYEAAIQSAVLATKFGFDLTAGLPNDASLGLLAVDDARRALAPSLTNMDLAQLESLSRSMKTVYSGRPSIILCYDYAQKDALAEVQDIQDTFRSESYAALEEKIGSTSKEVVPILKELHDQSEEKRAAFFEGFAQDAKNEAELLKEDASLPVAARPAPTPEKPGAEHPWRKLSRRLLGIGQPIQKMNDSTCAKTQLLILECQILRALKVNGHTPPNLDKFSVKLVTDPYSGRPFIYQTGGTDYKLYSVGEDLIDNDGETDEAYDHPDLFLEKPRT